MEFEKEFYTSCFYTRHPTQKSVNVLLFLIRTYSEEGNVVLDPFMGNGSTGVAAVKCGRRFIGIEKEQKYFDAALRRIERTYEDRALLEIA